MCSIFDATLLIKIKIVFKANLYRVGPPLETFQSVWRYSQTKRHGQYRRYFGGITEHHCSATESAVENLKLGTSYRTEISD